MASKKKKIVLPIVAGVFALGVVGSLLPPDAETAGTPSETASPAIVEQEADVSEEVKQDITIELSPEPTKELDIPEPTQIIEPSAEPLVISEPMQDIEPSAGPESSEASANPQQEPTPEPTPTPVPSPEKTPEPTLEPAPSIDPEQAFREKLNQYSYVGSSESDKYHYPHCRWTSKINDGNLVHFDTVEEAAAAGYSPCGTCHPK